MNNTLSKKNIVTGEWDGEKIWRHATAEEMLERKITLEIRHDRYPTNEIFINADCWCEFCSRKLPDWKMQNIHGDASVCEDCYEHYN